MINNPTPLNTILTVTAVVPLRKAYGSTGMIAPIEKRKKDVKAASQAEPPN
jgi:hypothetical protein